MAYGASNPGSEDDYFNDGPPKSDMKEGMDEEGLLPKSLMAGKDFKVGQEIVLEITHIGERDFSVRYASEEGSKDDKNKSSDMPEKETADMGGGGGSEMESSMY